MSIQEIIKKYEYLHKCHKMRNPRIAEAYRRKIEELKKIKNN